MPKYELFYIDLKMVYLLRASPFLEFICFKIKVLPFSSSDLFICLLYNFECLQEKDVQAPFEIHFRYQHFLFIPQKCSN